MQQETQVKAGRRAISVGEFCETYDVGKTTAYREMAEGRLPFALVGRRRLVPVDGAERWLAALTKSEA